MSLQEAFVSQTPARAAAAPRRLEAAPVAALRGADAQACAALVSNFGLVIRQLRERQGLSQERLSELSELNRSYVGEVERGRAIASIVTAHKLARALQVDVATLLRHSQELERVRLAQRLRLAAIAG